MVADMDRNSKFVNRRRAPHRESSSPTKEDQINLLNNRIVTSELVINVQPQDVSIAITEDKLLMEFHKEEKNVSFSVGNIYLGRVKKIMPGLNACFVDVGSGKEAFLHYLDLGSQFYSLQKYLKQITSDRKKHFPISKAAILPEKQKEGNISDALETGQEILVQITKEPISTKAPDLHASSPLQDVF